MKEEIIKILMERRYTEKQAASVASDLLDVDEQLKDGLQHWLSTNEEKDYEVADFKLSELKQQFDMTYPAALLTIDWLIKEPDLAMKAIKRGIR